MPALQSAKDSAKTVKCISNVKQLVLACVLYADDWEQMLPSNYSINPGNSRYTWYNQLALYASFKTGNQLVTGMGCPANTKLMSSTYAANNWPIGEIDLAVGIWTSKRLPDLYPGTMLFADDDGCQGSPTCNVTWIFSPALRPFAVDLDADPGNDSFSPAHLYNNVMFRHKNRAVCGCADGSVREISVKQWLSNDSRLWGR